LVKTRDAIDVSFWRSDDQPVLWQIDHAEQPYLDAVAVMERDAARIAEGVAAERVWLIEHPPLYTAGTSADDADLIDQRFPLHRAGRGGELTYHGPGQRVAYVMLNLGARKRDVRAFVAALERWIILALAEFSIIGERAKTV
jgi:lipoyl(octanoyl) transferase